MSANLNFEHIEKSSIIHKSPDVNRRQRDENSIFMNKTEVKEAIVYAPIENIIAP